MNSKKCAEEVCRYTEYYWRDAKKENPPYAKNPKRYIVILTSRSRSNHAKSFAGEGIPETAAWCNNWDFGAGWGGRGGLSVAFWMPLPEFGKKYIKGKEGESPRWE